jgi:DNA replication factor Dna2
MSFTQTLTLAAWTKDMLENEKQMAHDLHHLHSSNGFSKRRNVQIVPAGVVHLREEWYHTRLAEDDTVHIVSLTGRCRTDSLPLELYSYPPPGGVEDDLVLIVHPDMLLTPTVISEAVSCTRRATLKTRLGSTGLTSTSYLSCVHSPCGNELTERLSRFSCCRQLRPLCLEQCGMQYLRKQ